MAVDSSKTVEPVPESHPDPLEFSRLISRRVNGLLDGKLNAVGSLTLTASTTVTTVTELRAGINSVIVLTPTSANAAAEVGGGALYVASKGAESFVLSHANNAQTDRTFDYLVLGP